MDCLGFHFVAATELARIAINLIHVLDPHRAVRRDNTGSLPESMQMGWRICIRCNASGQHANITAGGPEGARVGVGSHLEYDSLGRGRPRPSRV